MRRLLAVALAMLALPPAGAAEPYETVIDWQEGHFLASTRLGIDEVDFWRYPFAVDECRRALLLDLLYSPEELAVGAPGIGQAALVYDLIAEIWTGDGAALVSSTRVSSSGYGRALGTLPSDGPFEIRLTLRTGADVNWSARLRAREVYGDLACLPRLLVNEVEADPPGLDAGAEWVELYHPGDETVDASGWVVSVAGETLATIPQGTLVAPGARLVVDIATSGAGIPATGAIVTLVAAFGYESDATPPLDDTLDDGRTWQRSPDGSDVWRLADATRGSTNGE